MKKKLTVLWLSGGASSFYAGMLSKLDLVIYIDIEDQHPDTLRYVEDCGRLLGKEILILKSRYGNVENVCRTFNYLVSTKFAKCSEILKLRVRKEWEYDYKDYELTYIWGYDYDELDRKITIEESNPKQNHLFPLIERHMYKQDVHAKCKQLGLKRPYMYDLGFANNNCIGCLKGGMGYWNNIRIHFPEVFWSRAKLERDLNQYILKDKNGPVFLDELDPNRGNMDNEIMESCSVHCILNGERW